MEVKIGNILYNNISKNEYLNEIYDNILINYTYKLLKKDISLYKIINMSDALRFADILSKSTSSSES